MEVGILGGGIAGLSFAYFLDKKSFILEKVEEIGGLCRSFKFKDINYDIGPHIIFSKNQEILDLHTNLIETNLIKRNNSVFYKNRFIKYPFENDLGSLPSEDKDYCLNEFLNNSYKNYESNNMLQFFLKTFGEGITRCYLQPYNEKIWKFDSCCLDTQMVDRIPRPPDEDVIKSAQGIPTEGYTHQLYFHYPKEGGFQTLINAYRDRIKEKTSIHREVKIESIAKVKGKWVVESNKGKFKSDLLVNCMPVHELFKYLEAPKSIKVALDNMLFNSIHIVLIRASKDNLGNRFAVNIPDKDVIFHRISKLDMLGKNYESKDGGSTILAEITYRPKSYLSTLSKEQIKASVIQGLSDCGFVHQSDITDIKLDSHKYAYVIYDLMHRENTDKVLKYLRSIGIHSNGRFAEFEYMNSDKVAENSMKLANELNK